MARAKRSRDEWAAEVARFRVSGQTAEVYAARHGLNVWTLRWWSSRIGTVAPAAGVSLREIVVEQAASEPSSNFELLLGGITLRFEVGTDPRYVAAVAAALAEAGRVC